MFIPRLPDRLTLLAYGSGGLLCALIIGILLSLWLSPEPGAAPQAAVVPISSALPATTTREALVLPAPVIKRTYVQIIAGCGPYFGGTCVNARSGPGTKYATVKALRIGVVLETSGSVVVDGTRWYRLVFNEWLRYPNRTRSTMYVSESFVQPYVLDAPADATPAQRAATTTKYILVDKSDQTLSAYDGTTLFMKLKISTGLSGTPTPLGHFTVYRKTPTRYMQGPIPGISSQSYDLPGVPWNLYFTAQGAVIHGAYWHDNFGKPWSHGCVNLPVDDARTLYMWADLGTPVYVRA